MAHALTTFIREQMQRRGMEQAQLVAASGLSRAHVSKLVRDERDEIVRPHDRDTLRRLAEAFGVTYEHILGLELQALGLIAEPGELVVQLYESSDAELLNELGRRLMVRGAVEGRDALPIELKRVRDAHVHSVHPTKEEALKAARAMVTYQASGKSLIFVAVDKDSGKVESLEEWAVTPEEQQAARRAVSKGRQARAEQDQIVSQDDGSWGD